MTINIASRQLTDEEIEEMFSRMQETKKTSTGEILNSCQMSSQLIKLANKFMGNNGRLLIRKSGTESKIRIMGESHNKSLILKCIKMIKKTVK